MIIILGVAIGAAVGRWWAVGIAIPIGLWFALEFDAFENSSPPYWDFGAVVTLVVGLTIAAGIFLRRIAAGRGVR